MQPDKISHIYIRWIVQITPEKLKVELYFTRTQAFEIERQDKIVY